MAASMRSYQVDTERSRVLDWLLAHYQSATRSSASDRLSALRAYAACPNDAAVTKLLNLALNPNVIRQQDLLYVV